MEIKIDETGMAKRLENEIKTRGITYRSISEKCGVNISTISRIINGKNKYTSYGTVHKLAKALNVDFNWLAYGGRYKMNYAYELRNEGKSLDEIAEASGFKSEKIDACVDWIVGVKWEKLNLKRIYRTCPACQDTRVVKASEIYDGYCPNCGQKMERPNEKEEAKEKIEENKEMFSKP